MSKDTEIDYEILKLKCETLSDSIDRLEYSVSKLAKDLNKIEQRINIVGEILYKGVKS